MPINEDTAEADPIMEEILEGRSILAVFTDFLLFGGLGLRPFGFCCEVVLGQFLPFRCFVFVFGYALAFRIEFVKLVARQRVPAQG